MAGYIGKSQGVTQVDGYNRTEADDRYVNDPDAVITVSGGNVGFGTNFPSAKLEVNGDVKSNKFAFYNEGAGANFNYTGYARFANGATESMRIDSAGRVTMPYQPAFDAVLTSGAAGVQFGANQRIVFNSTNTNIGNHYDTSTGRFTAPVAGLYMFSCTGMTLSTTWFKLLVNDAAIAYPHNPYETGGGTDWASASSTWLISLNASDFVSLHVGSSGVGIYGAGNNHNNFCGYLLG